MKKGNVDGEEVKICFIIMKSEKYVTVLNVEKQFSVILYGNILVRG